MPKLLSSALAALLISTPGPGPQDKPRDPAPLLTFQSLDRNHDRKITREEFADAFARLDRNHDGVITPDEASGQESRGPKGKKPKPGQGKRRR
jgi:hypothetical protein